MTAAVPDHFALFGLEPRFALDNEQLTRTYRTVQAHVHPDRYAAAGASEQRAALQWATLANEAYQVLSSPLRRAAYLCERNGVAVSGENARSIPSDFLELQLEWRQALEQIRGLGDAQRLAGLRGEAEALYRHELARLESRLDVEHDFAGAAEGVRRMMFIEKLVKELEAAGEETHASPAA